jgi:sugar diacid utilization regulator
MFAELRQAGRALRLARLAMDHQEPGRGVEQFSDSPLSVLLASAPDAAIEAARSVLGGLLELRHDDRDLLITTLLTWLEVGGSANAAGAALFCHPNTVRYGCAGSKSPAARLPTQLAESSPRCGRGQNYHIGRRRLLDPSHVTVVA